MLTKIFSATHFGLETIPIEVEVDINKKGFPGFTIIGLPQKSVEEAKERVKTALINSGISFPQAKVIVNLAPADIPKEGTCYDLPIAVGIVKAMGLIEFNSQDSFFYGELSLDGSLRHTKGVLLLALAARKLRKKNLYVPLSAANEAAVVEGINVYPVSHLKLLFDHLTGIKRLKRVILENKERDLFLEAEFDFSEIIGQEQAKRALEIAAAGGHNILLQGPPGSGKTMLARALPGILPPLNEKESLEVTKIYSVSGNIPPGGSLIRTRPFRAIHHTTSRIGLIGGSSPPRPGEISLAHCGVLFLDELPEFPRSSLEALRQPLEDGRITISRAKGSATFPAKFMLVAAANPCPCGHLGDPQKECRCTPRQISRYQSKLSGPLLDRIDLHLNVSAVPVEKLTEQRNSPREDSKKIRERVWKARKIQNLRFSSLKIETNAEMKNRHLKKFCSLTPEAEILLKQALNNFGFSARTYFRLIKVSQTIADLKGEKTIQAYHVAEALQYRLRTEE